MFKNFLKIFFCIKKIMNEVSLKGVQKKIYNFFFIQVLISIIIYISQKSDVNKIFKSNFGYLNVSLMYKTYFIITSLLDEDNFMMFIYLFVIFCYGLQVILILSSSIIEKLSLILPITQSLIVMILFLEFTYVIFLKKKFKKDFIYSDSRKVQFNPVALKAYLIRKKLRVFIKIFYFPIIILIFLTVIRPNFLKYIDFGVMILASVLIYIYELTINTENLYIRLVLTSLMLPFLGVYITATVYLFIFDINYIIFNEFLIIYSVGNIAITSVIIFGLYDAWHFNSGLKEILNEYE